MAPTLATAAAAALHAPKGVWIATLILAAICLIAAGLNHWREGRAASPLPLIIGGHKSGGQQSERATPPASSEWLDDEIAEIRALRRELEIKVGKADLAYTDYNQVDGIQRTFWTLRGEVLRKLRVRAPGWIEHFEQVPWHFRRGWVPTEDRDGIARVVECFSDAEARLSHIRDRVREDAS